METDWSDAVSDGPAVQPGRRDRALRRVVIGVLGVAAIAFVAAELNPSCLWEDIQAQLGTWRAWADRHPGPTFLVFVLAAATATALPLPVVTVLCLLAGALFGRPLGTAAASLGYTAGVTAAFLAARWALRERIRRRFGARWLGRVERGFERDGAYYLLALRLMPAVPFFLVNLLMALTPIRTRTFAMVSWAGVLPAAFLYAGLGDEVAGLASPTGLLSPSVIATLAALAVLPLAARVAARWLRRPRPVTVGESDG
jgi:uncharacterized membrane protein YdjX (TVP38/TMEM64 family)